MFSSPHYSSIVLIIIAIICLVDFKLDRQVLLTEQLVVILKFSLLNEDIHNSVAMLSVNLMLIISTPSLDVGRGNQVYFSQFVKHLSTLL